MPTTVCVMSISQHEMSCHEGLQLTCYLVPTNRTSAGYLFTWPDGCIVDKWFTAAGCSVRFCLLRRSVCSSSAHIYQRIISACAYCSVAIRHS